MPKHRRRLKVNLGPLKLLARLYNGKIPQPRRSSETTRQALAFLKIIVKACAKHPKNDPLPPEAVDCFNTMSAEVPIHLTIGEVDEAAYPDMEGGAMLDLDDQRVLTYAGQRETWAGMEWSDYRGYVLQLLWHWIQHPGRDRLKCCETCGSAFVDSSSNHKGVYCTPVCHNKTWTYAKRKASGHTR